MCPVQSVTYLPGPDLYYGAADTTICLAFAKIDELVAFVKAES